MTSVSGRIVVFGATGYTGELTARALVEAGEEPLLAGRSAARLDALARELGGLSTQTADVEDPGSVAKLVKAGDVLLSTVGPFTRWGRPALEAAIAAGIPYIDSTGETPFIRSVFEELGPRAERTGAALLTACGYDWVPGNLACGLALRDAGDEATRVDTGYFMSGSGGSEQMSGGTRASVIEALLAPSYAWRDGELVTERGARSVRSFELGKGRSASAVSVGTSEALSLPRVHPGLRELGVYLGWFGPLSRLLQASSVGIAGLQRVPPVRNAIFGLARRAVRGSTGGPDAQARAKTGSVIIAEGFDPAGARLSRVVLRGANGYDFTAGFLSWAARAAKAGQIKGAGALGPVEAFGLEELERGVAEAGISRADD